MGPGERPEGVRAYRFGPYTVDVLRRTLIQDGQPVQVQPKVFQTLLVLLANAGAVVDRQRLMEEVWAGVFVDERNLTHAISQLRRIFGETPDRHEYIVTVPGIGYKFVAPVTVQDDAAAGAVAERRTRSVIIIDEPRAKASPQGFRWLWPAALLALALPLTAYLVFRNRPVAFQRISVSRLTTAGNVAHAVLSPDGTYLAYVVGDFGQQSIRVRRLSSGNEVEIVGPSGKGYGGLNYSPEGKFLYYNMDEREGTRSVLYRIPALGGPPQRLKQGLSSWASVSPDGRQAAFVREDQQRKESVLIVADVEGSAERRLGSRPFPEFLDYPVWSPNGERIACTEVALSGVSVRVIEFHVDTGEARPISQSWSYVRQPRWMPDGKGLLASVRQERGGVFSIFHLAYPSGKARPVTHTSDPLMSVSLSADGRTIVSVQDRLVSSLWVAPASEPAQARQVLYDASRFSHASWSPDGRLFLGKQTGEQRHVWVMKADGSGQKQLTFEGSNFDPVVCPDGRHVIYFSEKPAAAGIWLMDLDGARQRPLTDADNNSAAECSPDGRWVVYSFWGTGKWPSLWKVSIEGGVPVQLNDRLCLTPSISPDGKWVACFYAEQPSAQADPHNLAIITFDGGPPAKVFDLPPSAFTRGPLRWTSDGASIAYVDNRDGVSNIWAQPRDGGPRRQLTNLQGDRIFYFEWSPDGKRLAFSRGTRSRDVWMIRDIQ